jgi:antitoxin VapB
MPTRVADVRSPSRQAAPQSRNQAGRNQAVRIPAEFELPGDEAIMLRKRGLIALLNSMTPLDEALPSIDDAVPPPQTVL